MSEQENTQRVQALYAAFGQRDTAAILDKLTDDVVWDVPGPALIPYAGRRFGRDQVAQFFKGLTETTDLPVFDVRDYVAQGDTVVALGRYQGTAKPTGRGFASDFAMVFTLRNGKVASFREYLDDANLAGAFDTGKNQLAGPSGTP